jgi:hypothetical protein
VSRQICQELTRLHDFCVQLTLLFTTEQDAAFLPSSYDLVAERA